MQPLVAKFTLMTMRTIEPRSMNTCGTVAGLLQVPSIQPKKIKNKNQNLNASDATTLFIGRVITVSSFVKMRSQIQSKNKRRQISDCPANIGLRVSASSTVITRIIISLSYQHQTNPAFRFPPFPPFPIVLLTLTRHLHPPLLLRHNVESLLPGMRPRPQQSPLSHAPRGCRCCLKPFAPSHPAR